MKINGNFKYVINSDNAVEIWELDGDENSAPIQRQPYPPGNPVPFASKEEAENWAEIYLTEIQKPAPIFSLEESKEEVVENIN